MTITVTKRLRNLRAKAKELEKAVVRLSKAKDDAEADSVHWYEIAVGYKSELVAAQEVIDSFPKSLISRIRDWIS